MRVLFVLSGLDLSGGERNVISVVAPLAEVGVAPMLCTLNRRRDGPLAVEAEAVGIERHDLDMQRLADARGWLRYVQLVRRLTPDVVHAQDQDSIILAAGGRRLTRVPLVVTRHVLDEPTGTRREAQRARAALIGLRHLADRVVAVSDATADHLVRRHGVTPERVVTVRNGLDIASRRAPGADVRRARRRELGWSDDFVVLMVGVLREGKGHDVLLAALPDLLHRVPRARVVLVGTGPLEAEVAAAMSPFGAAVQMLGQRTDVADLMTASDAVLLPSWSEALPTVLMEAGAVARPVVATRVGGAHEIVDDGVTGFLVDPGDARSLVERLAALAGDPALADRLGAAAAERVARDFSLGRQAAELAAVYRGVTC